MTGKQYPKWALENYRGSEEDFTAWLRQVAKDSVFTEILEKTSDEKEATAQAEAMIEHWVMSRTKELTKITERAFIFQLYEADRVGWFHYLPSELDTIEELLATMIDEMEELSTKYHDYKFIVETVMPMLRQVGAKPEDVWGLTTAVSKARVAVPAFRALLRDIPEDQPPAPETVEAIMGIARQISNPKVTYRPFKENMEQIRGKATKTLDPIPVEKFFMPGGQQWFVVKAPTEGHARAVEIGLKGLMSDLDVKDAFALILDVAGLIKKPLHKPGSKLSGEFEKLADLFGESD